MSLRTRIFSAVVALTCALAGSPASATPTTHLKFDRALRAQLSRGTPAHARVIVTVRPGARTAVRADLRTHGGEVTADYPAIGALAARVDGRDLERLARNPGVLSISLDADVRASASSSSNGRETPDRALKYYSGLRTQLGLTGSTRAGEGITVAVIDSGIAPVADFAGRIKAFVDFTRTNTPLPASPYDDYGHGTHVAGLIGSSGVESTNYAYMGVAPKVSFVVLKVLDENGTGATSNVIGAIQWVKANRWLYGIDAVNLSLGHPIYEPAETDPLVRAVEQATAAGLVVVTSAGNYGVNEETDEIGYAGITSPGNAPSAITVGSLRTFGTIERSDDAIASFSSRGPTWYDAFAKPDVVAPGDKLVSDCPPASTLSDTLDSSKVTGRTKKACYIRLSGTSMAAAVTTGMVALVLEAAQEANPYGPAITPNAVKAIAQYTAIPVAKKDGTLYDGLTQGTGGINAAGALTIAGLVDTRVAVNATWVPYVPEPVSTIGGSTYAWSQNIVWGTTVVSGSHVLYVNSPAWAENIVWGGALASGDNIVWGTTAQLANIVWGTAAEAWGDNIVWGTGLLSGVSGENIVWGTVSGDNIVWGTLRDDNIVWGTLGSDNIVWGTTAERD